MACLSFIIPIFNQVADLIKDWYKARFYHHRKFAAIIGRKSNKKRCNMRILTAFLTKRVFIKKISPT